MSLKDTQQPTSTSRSRRSKKHSKKKRTSIEPEHESRYNRDEIRRGHKKSFSKILSSFLGGKSKSNVIAIQSDSSTVKKSSDEINPPSSSLLPEITSHRKSKVHGDEYHHNKLPSSRKQLHHEHQPGDKIDFLKSVQLSNTNNLLQSASKKPKATRPSGKELIRPDTKTTSLQMFKNDAENVQNALSRKKSKFKKAVKERDILSFFDTGYVTTNSISDGVQINEVQNDDEVNFRSPLSTPQTEEEPALRPFKLRKEEPDLSNPNNTYFFKPAKLNTLAKPKETASNVFRFKKPKNTNSRLSRSKSTRTARSNSSNPGIWYCKRIPERRKDQEYDEEEEDYHEDTCQERDVLQANPSTYRYPPATSPRQRAEELVKKYFPRQLTPQEKKYLTYAIGIILATAGIAAFFLFLSRSKGKPTKPCPTINERLKVVDECCENEIEDECFPEKSHNNCWGIDDDDACVYEKHQCVKCQNPNYKAVVSATEKLHEDDDVVCALQDLKKVTKRVKGHKRTCTKRCNNGSNPRDTGQGGGKCGEYFKDSECTQKCDRRGAECRTQRCEDKCSARCA